jgi:L-ascorbate metabolism protein UlaG (beta-lactamase superfamily)
VIDGFFSRPPLWRALATRVAPDERRIDWALDRVELRTAAAVIVVHSHYDHAMDAPLVALRTGAVLVGSLSTANVARGLGFPEDRLRPVDGVPLDLGAFRVTGIRSRHFPHGIGMGEITAPLVPPARLNEYLEGGSYSVLIEHPAGTLLVQGSAGWEDGALAGRRADVVLLGVAGLGTREPEYTERYLAEVVDAVRPRLVVPIHWDDFSRPLTEPLVPLPRFFDDVGLTMRRLSDSLASRGVRMALLPTFEPVSLLPIRDE